MDLLEEAALFICDLAGSDDDDKIFTENASEPPRKRPKQKREVIPRPDYHMSVWWRFIHRPGVRDATHRLGKLFRRRFRVPFPIYEKLLTDLRNDGWDKGKDAAKRNSVPLELCILSSLRVLGRGEVFDTCSELSLCSVSTLRTFFHKFCKYLAEQARIYIVPPHLQEPEKREAAINNVLQQFKCVGLNGCVGSVDGCHIVWERCPAKLGLLHTTGFKGSPTLSYQARRSTPLPPRAMRACCLPFHVISKTRLADLYLSHYHYLL